MADFNGTAGPDVWVGTGDNETAHGGGGNDDLQGGGGNDTIYGEADDDTLSGDDGNDTIWGGTGFDHLFGGAGDDIFWAHHADLAAGEEYHGGSGTDTVLISTGASAIDLTGLVLDSIESLQAGALLISGDPNLTVTMTADQLNGLNNLYIGFGTLVIATGGTVDFTGGTLQLLIINLNAAGNTLNLSAVNVLNYSPTDGPYIYGGAASDTVFGSDNHDRIYGNDGDDSLHGGRFGSDLLDGGAGNDRLYFTHMSSSDAFYGGSGIDTFDASTATAAVTVTLGLNPGDTGSGPGGSQLHDIENLDGSTFGDTLTGDSGANRLQGLGGNDTLNGGAGNDDLAGGTGNDIYHVDSAGDLVTEAAGEGSDAIYASVSYALAAAAEIETLAALDANGTTAINLTGNAFANTLFGNAGANILDGGAGADTLVGRAGNDVYIVDDAGDLVLENGGEGSDEIRTALASYSLAGSNVENLTGLGAENQALTGNGAANVIDGGAGADAMAGGLGDDVYVVDNEGDVVTELAGEGTDEIRTGLASYTLGDAIENLTGISAGGQTLAGNGFNNFISGGSGNDALVGGAGNDTMTGGLGNDTYYVDAAGDVVNETAGQGNDRIATSASYALAAGAEVEQLEAVSSAATDAMDLTGNQFANTITGNAGVNILRGEGGSDILGGLAGNDYLVGGSGADFMYGGTGDDTYYVDNAGDQTSEQAGEGTDRIATSISYALLANSEIELLEGVNTTDTNALDLTGSNFANLIIGNAGVNILRGEGGNDTLVGLVGNDFLVGGTGADLMYGGVGDDTYYVDDLGDQANEASGEGTDRIATSISFALQASSEVELLETVNTADTNAMDLTGSDFANAIIGSDGVNILRGEGGNDTLTALGGNDFLVGGAGNDAMFGNTGNDTYYVDAAGDTVTELAGQGNDRISTSVSYTLAAGSEIETLEAGTRADTSAMNLTGNAFANTIVGNDGVNILDGKGGNDLLVGYGGADTFAFTTALGAGNVDSIADFTLNLDRILLGGDSGQPFAALAAGSLASASFVIGTQAQDADDRIIYNSTTGALLYDADGSGAGAAVQFATLAPGLALTAAHFTVSGAAGAPMISSPASASIAENSTASTIVYQAIATDPQGDQVTWSLTGADAHRLTINAATGAVRLKAPPDYEARPTYSFNVVASDSSASTAKEVTLNVTDLGSEDSATTRYFETPSLNGNTSQAQELTIFKADNNPNLYNDDLPSIYILGSISNNVDDDYFSISLGAGQLLILDVDGAPTALDTLLRIYSSGGTLLAENDDTSVYDPGSLTPPGGHNKDSMLLFRAETAGTYYFSIESFEHDSSGSYKLNVSVGPAASTAQLLSEDVDALLSGQFWDRGNLTLSYGFPTVASEYPGGQFTEVDPASKFAPLNVAQAEAVTEMLGTIANVSGLTFVRSLQLPGQADLRFGMTTDGDPAYAYLPTNEGPESPGGSVWFDRTDFNSPVIGNYAWMAMLHETGHALGLEHAHDTPLAVSEDRDSVEYTVMAYRSYPGQDIEAGGYTNETWGYAQTLMMLDIAALQRLYGANFNHNAGDTVYTWNSSTGEMSVNGAGLGRPGDSGNGSTPSSANRVFLTVWDGNGNDTYDMSNYSFGVRIDLQPGEWSRTSTVQLANLGEGHMARGNIANALLYNGDTRSLIENAIGGAGGDRLIANQAANKLTGNAGADVFQWKTHTDAGIGTLADRIMDFLSGTDKIDLGEVDSFPFTTSTNETFTFIGTAAFSGSNQLRYEVIDGHAHIFADLNNNHVADFEIIVMNVTTLVATDFIL